jgi:hypothetical protein
VGSWASGRLPGITMTFCPAISTVRRYEGTGRIREVHQWASSHRPQPRLSGDPGTEPDQRRAQAPSAASPLDGADVLELSEQAMHGCARQAAITLQALHLDYSILTPLLKRLASAGLLERERHTDDERLVHITLTDAGRELKARAKPVCQVVVDATGWMLGSSPNFVRRSTS